MTNQQIKKVSLGVLLATAIVIAYRNRRKNAPLLVASQVDLKKYMGEWYEIARLPARFEKNCYATKAKYTLRPDGKVEVVNTCHKNGVAGRLSKATGEAVVVDAMTNAKLKVQFFWPFKGDYWILNVGNNYEYAVVGEPSRENLWILSRQPNLDQTILNTLIEKAQSQGFDTSKLIYTKHQ